MERTATERLRANEKLKVLSTVITNLGTALFASAFGRLFLSGPDGWVPVWIVFGTTAIAMGIQLMSWLESETGDG
jgi:hypothetical protein